jgi:hypothetical protein
MMRRALWNEHHDGAAEVSDPCMRLALTSYVSSCCGMCGSVGARWTFGADKAEGLMVWFTLIAIQD